MFTWKISQGDTVVKKILTRDVKKRIVKEESEKLEPKEFLLEEKIVQDQKDDFFLRLIAIILNSKFIVSLLGIIGTVVLFLITKK